MPDTQPVDPSVLVAAAARALKERAAEVDRLNVFPVPDGDTGTNMSLTMDAVMAEVAELGTPTDAATICHAITHGSLMGARGNSGVILSQILRGLCDVLGSAERIDQETLAAALKRSQTVAYQAVRKPVEGTMLTVVKDAAKAAESAREAGVELPSMLEQIVAAGFDSVRRGPDLLPVLRENNVVDAGGFGLAILAEGFVAALQGREVQAADVLAAESRDVVVVPADDWADEEYLYCTEFLLHGDGLDRDAVHAWVSEAGGSELVVGDAALLKIHVHTDDPAGVLASATALGEVEQVHVNNMRRQTADRTAGIAASSAPRKDVGFVAVAAGDGLKRILESLGVDVVVNGGQTMNPSTKDLVDACRRANADTCVILPDNSNIVLAAQQVATVAEHPVYVVPTTSVPEAFSALLAHDPDAPLDDSVAAMTEAAGRVRTGEVTTAVKDAQAKVGPIRAGQVIGITGHEIEAVGEDVPSVALALAALLAPGADTATLLAGEGLDDGELEAIESALRKAHPDLEVECHRGDQPLYPLIMGFE